MSPGTAPILVAACGNAMAGDDIFGHLVVERLKTAPAPNIEVIELGANPARLIDRLADRDTLFVVDAAWFPDEGTGRLIDVDWFDPDRPPLMSESLLSTHGLSIADQLNLARRLDLLPSIVRLIAVTIGGAAVGDAVDTALRASADAAADIVRRRAARLEEPSHA
ncbi:MAG: hypothetical protein CMJ18_17870 [Phycisphaeraceae bacterium]|nr:hypothetical protein [Phycisphaeraceae bacterium]